MSNPHTHPSLSLQQICFKRAGRTILRDISLQLRPGELTLLTGHNGSGKSTLLRIIAGLLRPDAGQFDYGDGALSWRQSRRFLRAEVCYLHQQPYLFDSTVYSNIAYGLRQRGMNREQIRVRVNGVLKDIQLQHLADRHCRELSGGEQQRVAMARAWVLSPRLMLLDEPVANMDKRSRQHCLALINQLRQAQISVMLTSHDPQQGKLEISHHLHLYEGQMSEKREDESEQATIIPLARKSASSTQCD